MTSRLGVRTLVSFISVVYSDVIIEIGVSIAIFVILNVVSERRTEATRKSGRVGETSSGRRLPF